MKKAFKTSLLFVAVWASAVWAEVEPVVLVQPAVGGYAVSYALHDNDGTFTDNLLNELKAGNTLVLKHRFAVAPISGFWFKPKAEATAQMDVVYSSKIGIYQVKYNNQLLQFPNQDALLDYILSVENMPLTTQLETGTEYVVQIDLRFEPQNEGWLSLVDRLFQKQSLTQEVRYIAR